MVGPVVPYVPKTPEEYFSILGNVSRTIESFRPTIDGTSPLKELQLLEQDEKLMMEEAVKSQASLPVIDLNDPKSKGLSDPKAFNHNESIKYHQHVCNKIIAIRKSLGELRPVVQNLAKLGEIPESMEDLRKRMAEIDFLKMAEQCFQLDRCPDVTEKYMNLPFAKRGRHGRPVASYRRMREFTEPFSASKIRLDDRQVIILLKTTQITVPSPYSSEFNEEEEEGTFIVLRKNLESGYYLYDLKNHRLTREIKDLSKDLRMIKNYDVKPILRIFLPVVDSVSKIVVDYLLGPK